MALQAIIIILCLGVVVIAQNNLKYDVNNKPYYNVENEELSQQLFEKFIEDYNRTYADDEEKNSRYKIFKENLHQINIQNIKNPDAYFDISVGCDLTDEEFTARYTGFKPDPDFEPKEFLNFTSTLADVPRNFDWREKNVVTRVVDQGICQSCWAFSAIGNIEGQYAKKYGRLVEFSKQQLVSCDRRNGACKGGFMTRAFQSIMEMGGVVPERDYPYVSANNNVPQCRTPASSTKAQLSNYKAINLQQMRESNLKEVLVSTGPLSIAVAAGRLRSYKGGILRDCANNNVDHAVLLVGYGAGNQGEFWTIKNSWGANFGERGYFRMPLGKNCLSVMNQHAATSYVK